MGNPKATAKLSVLKNNSRAEAFDPALASLFASSVSLECVIRSARGVSSC